jgi:cytochrome P450
MRQRRLAQPAFHRPRLAGYADVMVDATAKMLVRWRPLTAVDVGPEMSRLALAVAGRTLFSRDVSDEADSVGREFPVVGHYLEQRFNRPFTTPPLWVPTPLNLRFKRALRALNGIVDGLIRERRREGRDHGDLLSMLMHARDEETGHGMTDEQLRSETLTFLMAGHETSATALTWTFFLLATHPAVRERARQEARTALGERAPALADVARLDYTRMVIEEAMRLYPPIWALPRQAVAADEIGGYAIPAGSTVGLCSYITHRHPDVWESPDVFDPERFTAARVAQRPKGAYFPFLAGPHQCIGNEFAMVEMRLVVAMVLREFDLELLPGQDVRVKASIVLKPSGPVRLALRSGV